MGKDNSTPNLTAAMQTQAQKINGEFQKLKATEANFQSAIRNSLHEFQIAECILKKFLEPVIITNKDNEILISTKKLICLNVCDYIDMSSYVSRYLKNWKNYIYYSKNENELNDFQKKLTTEINLEVAPLMADKVNNALKLISSYEFYIKSQELNLTFHFDGICANYRFFIDITK